MKQRVTSEQLDELSPSGKGRLVEWLKKCQSFQEDVAEGDYDPTIGALSIGQMIEFLDGVDSCNEVSIHNNGGKYSDENYQWSYLDCSSEYKHKELCDALWEACKQILND